MKLLKRNNLPYVPVRWMFILLSLIGSSAYAQPAQKWYFGIDIGLDFSGGGTPTLINTTSPATYDNAGVAGYNVESSSVAYDNSGNLVFVAIPTGAGAYSVFDKNFVNKGNVKTTSDAAQGSLIFPTPGSTTQYYLCTVDAMTSSCGTGDTGSDRGANYYVVNNTGSTVTLGAANNLVSSGVAECQVGIVHSNATDYWWVIHVRGSNEFRVYKVTSSGITYDHSDNVGYVFSSCDYVSQLAVNGCNNKIAMAINGTVSLFDFDNATGAISNSQQWALSCSYGLEFSTNNSYLYVSTGTDGTCTSSVYEYDITSGAAATINGTASNLGATNGGLGKSGHLQLGPDGNIYVAQMSAYGGFSYPQYIGRITNINSKPATFNKNFLAINDATNGKMAVSMGLPTILKASITGQAVLQVPNAGAICVGSNNTFSYNFAGVAVSQSWTLTPATGFSYVAPSTSTSASPTIKFTTAGTYSVKVTVTDNCGYTYSDVTSITVSNQINTAGTISCSPVKGNVTSPGAYTYVWYADAALTQPVATGSSNVSLPNQGTGTYYVAAQTSATPSSGSSTLLTVASPDSWANAAGTNTLSFTVNNPITLNSFDFASGIITNGTTDNRVYTVNITDNAGTNVYFTQAYTLDVYNSIKTQVVSPALTLAPGTYKIKVTGPSNPNTWSAQTTLSTADNAVLITGGSTAFGQFKYTYTKYAVTTAACSNAGTVSYTCPLPVTFVDFKAQREENGTTVLVNWSTSIEENSEVYYVQRSIDGIDFITVGEVNASSYSNTLKTYNFTDTNAPTGGLYYRIVEKDVDGLTTTTRKVYVNPLHSFSATLVPNPGSGSFAIVGISGDVKLQVTVYSVTGQDLYSVSTYAGEQINLDNVARGFYLVKIVSGTTEQTIRYINQ